MLATVVSPLPAIQGFFTRIRYELSFVGEPFPLVRDPLSLVSNPLPFVRDPIPLVSRLLAFARHPLPFGCGPPTHSGGLLALASRPLAAGGFSIPDALPFGRFAFYHLTRQ